MGLRLVSLGLQNKIFLSQQLRQDQSQNKPIDPADDDFADAVTHTFFQTWELVVADVELADEHIEISALVTHIDAESCGVVDDNDGQSHSHTKGAGRQAFIIPDGSDERNDETGVGRRHVAMGHSITPIPAVFSAKNHKFGHLYDETDKDRDEKDVIG